MTTPSIALPTADPLAATMERLAAKYTIAPQAVQPQKRDYAPLRFPLKFETNTASAPVIAAHKATQWWLNDLTHNEHSRVRWLTLHGACGCGKSHLLKAAHKIAKDFKKRALLRRATDIAADLRAGKFEKVDQILAAVPILFIDDFGAEYQSDFMAAQWYDLFDKRLGKWTFITTNLSPAQIGKQIDERIESRLYLSPNEIIDLSSAPDYRKLTHNKR